VLHLIQPWFRKALFSAALMSFMLASPPASAADIHFSDVSGARGIGAFTVSPGYTSGVNAADFDDDGDIDFFVPQDQGVADQLYQNDGLGNFTDIAAAAGVDSTDAHRAALFFDYDGDNLLDLAVAGDCTLEDASCVSPQLLLYRQVSTGVFQDVSVVASLDVVLAEESGVSIGGMAAGDINNDGYLDFFISMWHGVRTWLFLNDGDGTFTNISVTSSVSNHPGVDSYQPIIHDFNADGWMDVFEAVDFTANRLWINNQDNTFSDGAVAAGVDSAFNEMGVTLGDLDNDGDFEMFITNIHEDGKINRLYQNDTVGSTPAFTDIATSAGVDDTDWGWGATFFDADNDGWLDLAVTNGFYLEEIGESPWDTDPSRFFSNDGTLPPSFSEDSAAVGFDDTYIGSSLVSFDYDRDGDLDLLQTTMEGGPLRLLENDWVGAAAPNNHLVVRPRRLTGGNRRGIGATVRVTFGGTTYSRYISAGTSLQGQEPAEAHFGLGSATMVDSVVVEWPDGTTTTENSVGANGIIEVNPVIEVAIGSPTPPITTNGPILWTVSYAGADSVTLSTGDITLNTTGNATATLLVMGSGTSQRTVGATDLSGSGTLGISIAAETASVSGMTFTPAIGPSAMATVDSDEDLDGIAESGDNCPFDANAGQADTDADGEGDACNDASDSDGDEWADDLDNCPAVANADQIDWDFDHVGDVCDGDVKVFSVARMWNEMLLNAIRRDYPAPTVHSRNLFQVSTGMWDAWAAYDPVATGYFVTEKLTSLDVEAARSEAISFAAYRILKSRFVVPKSSSRAAAYGSELFDTLMDNLGYDKTYTATSGDVNSAAELGNRIADTIISFGMSDGANEAGSYADNSYTPANVDMLVDLPGVTQSPGQGLPAPELAYPNKWQPLSLDFLILQNGIPIGASTQWFLGSGWGRVAPFAMTRPSSAAVYHDPGDPPYLGCNSAPPCSADTIFKDAVVRVILFSSRVDPDDGVPMDIGPGAIGNSTLGTNDGTGYAVNPHTGLPYAQNIAKRADYGRILAEFWADGPDSETPPGHWNTLANYVSDHPLVEKRIAGVGPVVDDLEWDVKLYFAMNGAVSDAAIAAWDAKRKYDYVRPITMIRYMGGKGQSTDALGTAYHPEGLPLVPGLIELVTAESSAPGWRHENVLNAQGEPAVGEIAIKAWMGQPADPHTEHSGVGWIRAIEWLPYQRSTFVTPPFAAYLSGHSTFSRAGAEVLTLFTGDAYFPGGMGTFTAPKDAFLEFEIGPTEEVTLQWARYYDAADEAGISRLWGGIHVDADDLNGRIAGSQIGIQAYNKAATYWTQSNQVPSLDSRAMVVLVVGMLACGLRLAARLA